MTSGERFDSPAYRINNLNEFNNNCGDEDALKLTSISKSVRANEDRNSEQKWAMHGTSHHDRISTNDKEHARL